MIKNSLAKNFKGMLNEERIGVTEFANMAGVDSTSVSQAIHAKGISDKIVAWAEMLGYDCEITFTKKPNKVDKAISQVDAEIAKAEGEYDTCLADLLKEAKAYQESKKIAKK